jgi:uncharacterized protein
MSLWLTPQLKPFLGRTYLPPEDRAGQVGLKSLIPHLARMWKEQGEQIVNQADQMLAALRPEAPAGSGSLPIAALRQRALDLLSQNFDPANGGFEVAPKFPSPTSLNFLLDVAATDPDAAVRAKALSMVQVTLQHLAAGGIRDQLGGGFHRYAVDAQWRIPHFEKMLYDQAQLVSVYLIAGLLSGDAGLLAVARDTLRYVEQRMTDPAGGFYSAEDADSATSDGSHHEGAFYLWTEGEIARALEPAAANLFDYVHGVQPGGNVTGRGAEEFAGRNILRREHTLAEAAEKFNLTEAQVAASLADSRQKLATLTEQRPRPARDDKILTAWNGLMISAFARAGVVLNDPALTGTAARAADFVHANLWDAKTGRLARSFRAGQRTDQAFAEDYAFLIQGLLDLYEADLNPRDPAPQGRKRRRRTFRQFRGDAQPRPPRGDAPPGCLAGPRQTDRRRFRSDAGANPAGACADAGFRRMARRFGPADPHPGRGHRSGDPSAAGGGSVPLPASKSAAVDRCRQPTLVGKGSTLHR